MQLDQDAKILIVDDEEAIRFVVDRSLRAMGCEQVYQADCVAAARKQIEQNGPFALVILDIRMPGEPGTVLLKELGPQAPHVVTVMATATADIDTAVSSLKAGAYDYLLKPLIPDAVQLAVGRALRKRMLEVGALERQERIERLAADRMEALQATRRALVNALCQLAEFRDAETGAHLRRIPEYARALAHDMAQNSPYGRVITAEFTDQLTECASLHDIGKVAVRDSVLLKPGPLTPDEFEQVKLHTVYGRDMCLAVKRELGDDRSEFINMAIDITLAHHERWDGKGYPDGSAGFDIPLAGRMIHLVDFYDACRGARVYRPDPIPRDEVVRLIEQGKGTNFDPRVVESFLRLAGTFSKIEDGYPA